MSQIVGVAPIPRGISRLATLLALLVAMLATACGQAHAWPWSKDKKDEEEKASVFSTKLDALAETPRAYIGREVKMTCRFAGSGKLFKAYNTEFSERDYNNFSVWPSETQLWDPEARKSVVPTMYVSIKIASVCAALEKLQKYDLIEVHGVVMNDYANLPWINVTYIKSLAAAGNRIDERSLQYIRNAATLEKEGKFSAAANNLTLAVEAGLPKEYDAYVFTATGRNLLHSGDLAKAAEWLGKAYAVNSGDATISIDLADAALRQNDAAAAMEWCKKALAVSSAHPEVYAMMGEAKGSIGKVADGLADCDQAANTPGLTPMQKAKCDVSRARILTAGKRYNEAVASYVRALGPDSPLTGAVWLHKEIGGFYEKRFQESSSPELIEEAIRSYDNACVVSGKKDPEAITMLARAHFTKACSQQSTAFSQSLELLDQALQLDQDFTPARLLRGQIFALQGKADDAQREFSKAGGTDPKVALVKAEMLEKSGDKEKALAAYASVLEKEDNPVALRKAAELAEQLGQAEQARGFFRRLAAVEPPDPWANSHYAGLLIRLDDYEGAMAAAKRAVVPGKAGSEAHALIAIAADAKGDRATAEREARAALKEDATHAAAAALLGNLLADQNKELDKALATVRAASQANPKDVSLLDAAAWLQFKKGEKEAAYKALTGIAQDTRTRLTWHHLGLVCMDLDKWEEAVAALEQSGSASSFPNEISAVAERIRQEAQRLMPEVRKNLKQARRENAKREQAAAQAAEKAVKQAAEMEAERTREASAEVANPAAEQPKQPQGERIPAAVEDKGAPEAPTNATSEADDVGEEEIAAAEPEPVNTNDLKIAEKDGVAEGAAPEAETPAITEATAVAEAGDEIIMVEMSEEDAVEFEKDSDSSKNAKADIEVKEGEQQPEDTVVGQAAPASNLKGIKTATANRSVAEETWGIDGDKPQLLTVSPATQAPVAQAPASAGKKIAPARVDAAMAPAAGTKIKKAEIKMPEVPKAENEIYIPEGWLD